MLISMYSRMAPMRSGTLVNEPRRRRLLVKALNQHSTRFSHDEEVGVKWKRKRGLVVNQRLTSGCL